MRERKLYVLALLAAVLALAIAGCGGDDDDGEEGGEGVSGSASIMAVWTAQEAASFEAVLDGFTEQNPDASVDYTGAGEQLPTQLATAVEGGNPPDLAAVAQPGLVSEFFQQGALQPLDFAEETIRDNFPAGAIDVATFEDQVHGFVFKTANKSTLWYNVGLYEAAGVEPPETFEEFIENAETLRASGTKAYSIGVDAGWPLTDIFENIYLRQAGAEMYDQLAAHEIPWTDQSVKDSLELMAQIVGDSDNLVGGVSGALGTDFPTSVTNAFKENPDGAQVLEGDFVQGELPDTAEPLTVADFFEWPSVDGSGPVVVGGGDTIVMFNDSPVAQALVEYLASPEAAEIWAARGGFLTANQNVDTGVYPDELSQKAAQQLADAEEFRFDLSDVVPAAFGATTGQGMWQILQDLLRNPDDVDGVAERLENAASRAQQ